MLNVATKAKKAGNQQYGYLPFLFWPQHKTAIIVLVVNREHYTLLLMKVLGNGIFYDEKRINV